MATNVESVELVGDEVAANLARAALFAALTGGLAYVSFSIPFSPVPVTLQVLGVFLAGAFLGPVWGGAAMALYLLAGALGLPVFAGGTAGVGVVLSQYGGYVWGFVLGAAVVGGGVSGGLDLPEPSRVSVPRLVAALVAGALVVYAAGVAQLVAVGGVGVWKAVVSGAAVFVPGEVLKMAATVGIVRSDAVTAD
ncbi:MAG: biotin transporter BioY [Haloferacaceae archaeon]